MNKPPRF